MIDSTELSSRDRLFRIHPFRADSAKAADFNDS